MASPVNFDDFQKARFEYLVKLLDIFETRQTWTFNFAVTLYGLALAAAGALIGNIIKDAFSSPAGSMGVASIFLTVLIFSFLLPLLMMPLCYLYADVSIYCAAITAAYRDQFDDQESVDPARRAQRWLRQAGLLEPLHTFANRRFYLFFYAPTFGISGGVFGTIYSIIHCWRWVIVTCFLGVVISCAAFCLTQLAYVKVCKARASAHTDIV